MNTENQNNPSADGNLFTQEVARRRTFAIISHPDAGKTTLTEKLLLYGGVIRQAGSVKAKAGQKQTTSDWMELEKQRGISISSTVLQFDYEGVRINLLDTPGHKDFSEDTYRTLMAADASVMLIDAAKGVETQTRKLFEVCRMRGIPIFTFINKMDRPGRDPLDLLDELEKVLGIRSCPMNWPIGMGDRFKGVFDLQSRTVHLFDRKLQANAREKITSRKIESMEELAKDPEFGSDKYVLDQFMGELELLEVAGDPFNKERILQGQLSPVFFGSAMSNFGVELFLKHFISIAPPPAGRLALGDAPAPTSPEFSAIVFKIQANMDPMHRDCLVFIRVCSGRYSKGMRVYQARTGEEIRFNNAFNLFGRERVVVEDAFAGDVIGVIDTNNSYRIGDTLSEKRGIEYETIPRFAPENFARVTGKDPSKRKQLNKGVEQLAAEGVIQVLHSVGGYEMGFLIAVVGVLQFEVFAHRMKSEYGIEVGLDPQPYAVSRWIVGGEEDLKNFTSYDSLLVKDSDGKLMMLFKDEWSIGWLKKQCPKVELSDTFQLKTRVEE
ncbi:MAG: peptide chain release factor 3 [Bdellovibrionales bacterium]|nr:peptide chain release factor 3 [Bdellovibrionales bacterium]